MATKNVKRKSVDVSTVAPSGSDTRAKSLSTKSVSKITADELHDTLSGRLSRGQSTFFTSSYSGKKPNQWCPGRRPPDMLDAFGNREWHSVQKNVNFLLTEEYKDPSSFYRKYPNKAEGTSVVFSRTKPEINVRPIKTLEKAIDTCMSRYVSYVLIIRQLETVMQYLVHPQKRRLVVRTMDGAIIRMLEYRSELVKLDCREFQLFDHILQEMGITYDDIELSVPKHFLNSRFEELNTRKAMLDDITDRLFPHKTNRMSIEGKKYQHWMTITDAVLLLQRNERSFQGRTKFSRIKLHVIDLKIQARHELIEDKGFYFLTRKYVTLWKGAVVRKAIHKMRNKEFVRLGMEPDWNAVEKSTNRIEEATTMHLDRNAAIAEKHEKLFLEGMATQELEIIHAKRLALVEELKRNIMQWILELRDLTGTFPQFPTEEEGGSLALFKNDCTQDDINYGWDLESEDEKKKDDKEDKKKDKKKEKKKDDAPNGKNNKKKSKEVEEEFSWTMPIESNGLPLIETAETYYSEFWFERDESKNWEQSYDRNVLQRELIPGIESSVRREVDALIREELDRLTMAVDRQKQQKGKSKPPKPPKAKKGRKKSKDLTGNMSIEDMFEELVAQEIIIPVQHSPLSDFLGSHCYSACVSQDMGEEPQPSLATVKRQVMEMVVIPLSSATVHEGAPLTKSILLTGVRNTGKKMLVHSMCHEAGASLFDLTATNLEGKYEGKQNQKMFMQMIMKVGKAMEPSIFWVDRCEKLFLKKVDKTDISKPQRWAPFFTKALKKIQNGDRLMFVGTTKQPYAAKQKGMLKCFEHVILVPRPDYNSRLLLWDRHLTEILGKKYMRDLDLSSLSKVTSGFTVGAIVGAIRETLTEMRVFKVKNGTTVIKSSEFISKLCKYDPIYVEEEEIMMDWYMKTPLIKQRIERNAVEDGDT